MLLVQEVQAKSESWHISKGLGSLWRGRALPSYLAQCYSLRR